MSRLIKICVVGDGGVGKSSITLRYLRNEFSEYYDPTIENSYQTEVEFRSRICNIEIVDTAGQEEFLEFCHTSLAQGHAFVAVFAINSASSWDRLKELRDQIVRDHEDKEEVPMVVVANKKDMEESKQVSMDDIVPYCRSIQTPFIETSAKTGLNINEAFQLALEQIRIINPELLGFQPLSPNARQRGDGRAGQRGNGCVLL
ncbi:ras-like protein rasD [Sycon ciliatum]|uniref:ras-like protein rasD n=1 Tax=Sycon ciliatum TaxID=27933 RepID=UPI0020ABD892|eukprot:scpid77456/ scgid3983/ Ras-like protein rasY